MLKVNLVITGRERAYTRTLKKMARRLGVSNRVTFTGLLTEKELAGVYQNAAVYIYTAPEEDFGMGIVEAMAHGVPVVAWNNAGPSYIINNKKTGSLAKPSDINDFTKKVGQLLTDKKFNKKIALSAYSESKNYTWIMHGEIIDKKLRKLHDEG